MITPYSQKIKEDRLLLTWLITKYGNMRSPHNHRNRQTVRILKQRIAANNKKHRNLIIKSNKRMIPFKSKQLLNHVNHINHSNHSPC